MTQTTLRVVVGDAIAGPHSVTVYAIDNAHYHLLALHAEMRRRLEEGDIQPVRRPVLVVASGIASLRVRLVQHWQQVSTQLDQETSPALHALDQLIRHGRAVRIWVKEEPRAASAPLARVCRRGPVAARSAARSARLWRGTRATRR